MKRKDFDGMSDKMLFTEAKRYNGEIGRLLAEIISRLKEAPKIEREECASVCENGRFLHDEAPDAKFGKACAAAIRARSNKD